jgi:hypothetical protein
LNGDRRRRCVDRAVEARPGDHADADVDLLLIRVKGARVCR